MNEAPEKTYSTLNNLKIASQRRLNDLYLIALISMVALEDYKSDIVEEDGKAFSLEVPSSKGGVTTVKRSRNILLKMIDNALARDIYRDAIILGITIIEDYIYKILEINYRWYPRKLISKDNRIEVSVVLEAEDINQIVKHIIDRDIHSALYKGPKKLLKYLEDTLNIKLPEELQEKYAECKATRDILIHNNGIVNKMYVEKASCQGRKNEGEEIPLDMAYFEEFIAILKKTIASISTKYRIKQKIKKPKK